MLIGAVLGITVVLGTLLAVLYERRFFGRNVAILLAIAPFFVMPTVSALVWKNMIMHPVYGLLARAFAALGLAPLDWFGRFPMLSIIIILSWEWLPFAFLILYTSLKSLDPEQREAARIDGASAPQAFFHITIPHLKRAIGVVVMIETIFLLSHLRRDLHHHLGRARETRRPTWPTWCIRWACSSLTSASPPRGNPGGRHGQRGGLLLSWSASWPGASKEGPDVEASRPRTWLFGILGWLVALLLFFPIFWMALTAFKTEQEAYSPSVFFLPTLGSFREVFSRSNYVAFALNLIYLSLGSTLLCFLIAVPAAYKMAFFPTRRTGPTLVWMLSTKMMPSVGVLLPVYLLFRALGLLDSVSGLILICTLINLPIAIWMSYTLLLRDTRSDPGGGAGGWRRSAARNLAYPRSPGVAGNCLNRPAADYPLVERSLLEHQPHQRQGGAPDRVYRVVFEPGGLVLGEALGGVAAGGGPHHGDGLAHAEATGQWPYLWRRQMSVSPDMPLATPSPANDGSVRIRGLAKTYANDKGHPAVTAVKGLNLDIQDGEFMVLVGPSGCGKSTTLRMIAGLEEVTGGTIEIGGRVVNHVEPKDRDIAMVFQNYALYPHMTVFDNMAFGLKLREDAKGGDPARRVLRGRRDARPRQLPRPQTQGALRRAAPARGPGARHRPATRRSSCSTSRSPTSTPKCASRCARRSPGCTPGSRPR